MPVLSYLHHLFNPERCQAYIHTLLKFQHKESA
jgi:hypothetical protein